MAYKKTNLYITEECWLDPNSRRLYGPAKPKGISMGKQRAVILEHMLRNPNMPLSTTQFSEELNDRIGTRTKGSEISENALKKQVDRIKEDLEEVSGSDALSSLFTSADRYERWTYHQPKEVLELQPLEDYGRFYYSQSRKVYDDCVFPRLICTYEAQRTRSINEVINRFMINQEQVLFITGEAGIGKSELAFSVGRKLAQLGYHVAKMVYEGSLRNAVLELYPDISGVNEQIVFEKKLNTFMNSYDGEFVIVDNFYDPDKSFLEMQSDEVFRKLLSSNIHLIFVTRYQQIGIHSFYEVRSFDEDQQISLMRGGGLEEYRDDQLAVLCRLVGGNTLLCDMIGKLLRNTYAHVTVDDIETILKNNQLSSSAVNVHTEKDRVYREEPIYQQLCGLCGKVAITEAEKPVLNAASFLPLEGMDEKMFSLFCGCDANILTSLHNKGLLKANDSGKVLLHALYTLYYRDPSNGSDICRADVTGFIDTLCEWFNSGDISDHGLNNSICSTLRNAYQAETDTDRKAKIGLFLACYLGLSGRYTEAYEIEKECIGQGELQDQELLGKLYKDIAISAGRLDRDEETVSYLEKAAAILKDTDNSVAYLQAVNSLAYAYGKAGDHQKQKEIAAEAISGNDYTDHPDNYVRILNNLADSEYRLGEYDEAEAHIKEAVTIYGTLEGAPIIWTIQAKRLYGNILFAQGRKEEAVQLIEETLKEAYKSLEDDHLEIIRLNSCLGDMLDPGSSKEYYAEAVKRAVNNPIAGERLRSVTEDGHRYIVFISEGGTLFKMETEDDADFVPLKKAEAEPRRVIVYSIEDRIK